jgi:hypothetical protein
MLSIPRHYRSVFALCRHPPCCSRIVATQFREHSVKKTLHLLSCALLIALSSVLPSHAQGPESERNATAEEIAGNWELLPLPDSIEPKVLKSNPWPAACQWFSYGSTGVLKSIDRTNAPCEALSSAEFEKVLPKVSSVATWTYDLSPAYQKALIIVKRTDVAKYVEYWMPHIITHPFSKDGVEFQRGDLLLYLVNLSSHNIVWIRHLRKMS